MSARTNTLQKRFKRAASQDDVSDCVAIARAEVRHELAASSGLDLSASIEPLVTSLVGPDGEREIAAVMVGIAIGQLYHPDVFVKGGAK